MTRFDCTRVDELMMDFLYHELGHDDEAAFHAHLDTCPQCARSVRELRGVREAARELPRLEPPPALSAQLLLQAAKAKQPSAIARALEWLAPRRTYYLVAAAASLVVVLFVGYALQRQHLSTRFDHAADTVPAAAPADPTARPPAAAPAPAAPAPTTASPAAAAPAAAAPAGAADKDKGGEKSGALGFGNEAPGSHATLNEAEGKNQRGPDYPVRLDDESLRRDRAAAATGGDSNSNIARAYDGVPHLRKGGAIGGVLGGGGAAPGGAKEAAKAEARPEPSFAQPPALPQKKSAYDDRRAPVAEERPAAPPTEQAERPSQAPPPPAAAARPAPAAGPAPVQAPSAGGEIQAQGRGLGSFRQGQVATKRSAGKSQGYADFEVNAEAQKLAPRRQLAQPQPLPDQHGRAAADGDYKVAMAASCERQIGLLGEFLRRYPNDDRAAAARARIAVCRAQLTGRTEELDQIVGQQRLKAPAPAPARVQSDAARERKTVAKPAPRKPAAQQQAVAEKKNDGKKAKAAASASKAKPAGKKAAPANQQSTK
ncbi:MAG TPA: zf-HC2 domain-containing protein [Polyangia bacterium]|jgi:hypothetical protein